MQKRIDNATMPPITAMAMAIEGRPAFCRNCCSSEAKGSDGMAVAARTCDDRAWVGVEDEDTASDVE